MEPLCSSSQEVLLELEAAIEEHSLYDVLRCLCEATHHGVDLTDPLPSSVSSSIVFFIDVSPEGHFFPIFCSGNFIFAKKKKKLREIKSIAYFIMIFFYEFSLIFLFLNFCRNLQKAAFTRPLVTRMAIRCILWTSLCKILWLWTSLQEKEIRLYITVWFKTSPKVWGYCWDLVLTLPRKIITENLLCLLLKNEITNSARKW